RYAFEPNTLKSQEIWSITQQSVRNPDQQAPSSREYAMSFARLFANVASPILAERHGSPKRSFRLRRGSNWRKSGCARSGFFRSKHYANRDALFPFQLLRA